MKVRNIVFSGFAAAILMGTANAATTPFEIASKAYVDAQVKSAAGDTIGDMTTLQNGTGSNIEAGTDNVVDALNDLDSALNTKQNEADSNVAEGTYNHLTAGHGVAGNLVSLDSALGDVETKVGETSVADQINDKLGTDFTGENPAYTDVSSALDGKVNVSDKATSIRTVAGGASDDKWATEKAVAAQIEGITGGAGTVDQQIADALGDDFTGDGAYEDVTAALADKQDKSDSTVDAADVTAANHLTAGAGVADNLVALGNALGTAESDIDALETTVNGAGEGDTGLVGAVEDLQNALNGDGGLDGRVGSLEDKVGDGQLSQDFGNGVETLTDAVNNLMANKLNSPIPNECSANSQHCVLSMDNSGNLRWVDVTAPWSVEEETQTEP